MAKKAKEAQDALMKKIEADSEAQKKESSKKKD